MKELKFKTPHDIGQLHAELEEKVAELRPADVGGERVAVMHVQSKGDEIVLLVPDGVDEKAVEQVVTAHKPKPRQPPPDRESLIGAVEAAKSLLELKAAVVSALRAWR